MTGLRDRKKEEARRRIVRAATSLFASDGLDATTMEGIAAAADVSVGTVYNYFGTKNALLLAGVAEDTELMVADGAAVLSRPGTNPVKAVQRLMGGYLDHLLSWEPAFLREVLAAALERSGGEALTAELAQMDQRLIEQLTALLTGFHDRGRLRADVAPVEATMLLFSAMVTQLFLYLAMDWFDEAVLRSQLDRQIDIAFSGLTATSDKRKDG